MKAPLELLASQERAPRPPLPGILARVERMIDDVGTPSACRDADVFALLQCFNLCALVEAMAGRAERARDLCQAELRWLAHVAEHSGRIGALGYAFQPWVNLARLERFSGQLEAARARLEVLRTAWQGRAITQLDGIALGVDDMPALFAHVPGLPWFLRYNWIHEGLLCELRGAAQPGLGERLGEIAAVAHEQASVPFNGMAFEAALIARRQAGDGADAVALSCPFPEVLAAYPVNLVASIRRAELALRLGSPAREEINAPVLSQLGQRLLDGEPTAWHLAVVQPIVQLLRELQPGADLALAAAAFNAAQRLDDEVLQAWFTGACADAGEPAWQARREALAEQSWHAAIASREQRADPARHARLDAVHEKLLDTAQRAFAVPPPRPAPIKQPSLAAPLPQLLEGIRPSGGDDTRATARLRFWGRALHPLAPIVDEATPALLRTMIETLDFARQPSFAARRYAEALALSGPLARHLLERAAALLRTLISPDFDEDRIRVTVRVDEKASYRALQGPHVDWSKGTVFDEHGLAGHGQGASVADAFSNLARCVSVDAVVGAPQTDYFLDPCEATCRLVRGDAGVWIVDAIDFDLAQPPQPAPAGCFLLRLPFTIHQFPAVERWRGAGERRLFVSCDYHGA